MYVKAFTFGGVFIWLVWMASATPHYVCAMASHEPSGSRPSLDRLPRLDANITGLSGGAGGADDRAVVCDWTRSWTRNRDGASRCRQRCWACGVARRHQIVIRATMTRLELRAVWPLTHQAHRIPNGSRGS